MMMKPKVDQLEIRSETEAIAIPQENGPELEHLKKVAAAKDDLAERVASIKEVYELKETHGLFVNIQEESQLQLRELNALNAKY